MSRSRPHRGAALIAALVCLAIVGATIGWLVRSAAMARQAQTTALWGEQAHWLADSAVERAAARLAGDANYAGETWTIPAAAFRGRCDAKVEIEVQPVAQRPDARRVRVTARYPDQPHDRAQASRLVVVSLSK